MFNLQNWTKDYVNEVGFAPLPYCEPLRTIYTDSGFCFNYNMGSFDLAYKVGPFYEMPQFVFFVVKLALDFFAC